MPRSQVLWSVFLLLSSAGVTRAAEPEEEVLAGHSYHGEAFNEGPRQSAYRMPGMAELEFPVTTESPIAQRFVTQGVAQLHGFWYYEAERSFRQAAVLDPDCAMTYWGMAMANTGNRERAQGFIEEAQSRKENASKREQLYIDALAVLLKDKNDDGKEIKKKDRSQKYTHALEEIVEEYPDDIEAKAFLAVHLWQSSRDLPIVSHVAVNALLQQVFDANPNHPAHHYRIHLWDRHKAKRALESAAMCGPSLPGVAHMWHMPGHIYDKLHRYHDAAWQQEASARVDHSHMMRDRVLPDQIHNFAHNNEWLIRSLNKIGRVEDALSLAKNMTELPRHPKYNVLSKRGSTKYGRERLLLTLTGYRLWSELLELSESVYLPPTDDAKLQIEHMRHVGVARALAGHGDKADASREMLAERLEAVQTELAELKAADEADKEAEKVEQEQEKASEGSDEAEQGETAASEKSAEESTPKEAETKESAEEKVTEENDPDDTDEKKAAANRERRKKERESRRKELNDQKRRLEKAHAAVESAIAASQMRWDDALEKWSKSDLSDNLLKAEWMHAAGKVDEALKLVDKEIDSKSGQILPLAQKVFLLQEAEKFDDAEEVFNELRDLAWDADLDTPLLARLSPMAKFYGHESKWASEYKPADDLGDRPSLDTLGPFRWQPYLAPDFLVKDTAGKTLRMKKLKGKPTLLIFYLGFGCLHCVEQLHEFSPRADEFRRSGIEVMAISTESEEELGKALKSYSDPLDIPLHADPRLAAFKAFRCYDDFEKQPLHGTFLIDPDGKILWQDISYEPFMDVDFAMEESHRLLNLAGYGDQLSEPVPSKVVK